MEIKLTKDENDFLKSFRKDLIQFHLESVVSKLDSSKYIRVFADVNCSDILSNLKILAKHNKKTTIDLCDENDVDKNIIFYEIIFANGKSVFVKDCYSVFSLSQLYLNGYDINKVA